jgi:hypothetical protein
VVEQIAGVAAVLLGVLVPVTVRPDPSGHRTITLQLGYQSL